MFAVEESKKCCQQDVNAPALKTTVFLKLSKEKILMAFRYQDHIFKSSSARLFKMPGKTRKANVPSWFGSTVQ